MHRYKTLKDDDLVPEDSVDNGEQEEVEEVLGGEGLDLSYLWVVDAGKVFSQSKKSISDTEGSSHTAKRGSTTDSQVKSQYEPAGCGKARASYASLPLDGVSSAASSHGQRASFEAGQHAVTSDAVGHYSLSHCPLVSMYDDVDWGVLHSSSQPHSTSNGEALLATTSKTRFSRSGGNNLAACHQIHSQRLIPLRKSSSFSKTHGRACATC